MRIGSLVKDISSIYSCPFGIVVGIGTDYDTVRIHWMRSNRVRTWRNNSPILEVLCE